MDNYDTAFTSVVKKLSKNTAFQCNEKDLGIYFMRNNAFMCKSNLYG